MAYEISHMSLVLLLWTSSKSSNEFHWSSQSSLVKQQVLFDKYLVPGSVCWFQEYLTGNWSSPCSINKTRMLLCNICCLKRRKWERGVNAQLSFAAKIHTLAILVTVESLNHSQIRNRRHFEDDSPNINTISLRWNLKTWLGRNIQWTQGWLKHHITHWISLWNPMKPYETYEIIWNSIKPPFFDASNASSASTSSRSSG